MGHGTFGTVINCMDGRTQEPVARWMRSRLALDYVDTITEPGADRLLPDGSEEVIAAIKRKVLISTEKHGSKVLAVVGHHDCAGNPVTKEQHIEQIKKSAQVISSWGLNLRVLGLWVGESWTVEKVCDSEGGKRVFG